MSWIFISYENSDQEHIREITSFDTEKEAAKYRIKDLEFYGYGSYEIYEVDDKED
jgi:hypothetical protein